MRVRLTGPLEQVFAGDHEQPLARIELEPALQLLRVATSCLVREVPPCVAEVARVAHALELALHPRLLVVERLLERERLASERDLVVVVRERPVDRVPHERDQPRVGNERCGAFRRVRVEEVARARLADQRVDAGPRANRTKVDLVRKVAPVPRLAAPEVPVEEADLLPRRPGERRMLAEICVQRGRPCLLRADDQEVRKRPRGGGRTAVRPHGVPGDDPNRRRNRRDQLCPQPHAGDVTSGGLLHPACDRDAGEAQRAAEQRERRRRLSEQEPAEQNRDRRHEIGRGSHASRCRA